MALDRRQFLELASGSLVYGFAIACGAERIVHAGAQEVAKEQIANHGHRYFVDYTEWMFLHPDGSVTAHTGRTELGQGLKTVLTNVVSQGLDLAPEKVEIVMGDTDSCPDDGPTEGSSATRIVGWGHWHACARIREDLLRRAAKVLECPAEQLTYADGAFASSAMPERKVTISQLADDDGTVQLETISWKEVTRSGPVYVDRKTPAVNAEAIVTGTLQYVGDLFPGECCYGAYLVPEYHIHLSGLEHVDLEAARKVPGVVTARRSGPGAFVVADSYTAAQRGLDAMQARWKVPSRPKAYDKVAEIRAGARLRTVREQHGDAVAALAESSRKLSETYVTQYASQTPIEPESALAAVGPEHTTVWASTQAPFKGRPRVARAVGVPEEQVRIVSMPVGGGFGVKIDTPSLAEAAHFAKASGKKVKHIYSRAFQFVNRARYKEAVVADITSAVTEDGRLIARTLDLHQDEGYGSAETYSIPNVRTRLFHTDVPPRHGTMRGTSFVQTCFAVESHTDMLAEMLALDPIEFRKKNLFTSSFAPLLDACAEMLGYGARELEPDRGIGFAICTHGGRQLGAVGAEVSVDRATGVVRVDRLAGAYDIGIIININTLTANTNGAMIWGLGFALFEEVRLDGHTAYARSFDDYRIPRFSDVPPIELAFLNNESAAQAPRGCGELPVIPTVGAIANAVYRAIGVRFYELPLTPQRVLAGLAAARREREAG